MPLSPEPTRRSTPEELGVQRSRNEPEPPVAVVNPIAPAPEMPDENDSLLKLTRELMADGFAGVILSGPPGTSKSWNAKKLAKSIATSGNDDCVRYVQFHPSYQYEDFIESYEPTEAGGFRPKPRTFLTICEAALAAPELQFVLVIDELSRCDAVRVFGEALTYLEKSQRNLEFELASGRRVVIPGNVFIVATMNPWDRGVDELDMAFERRFAKIAMEPDVVVLEKMLVANSLPIKQVRRLVNFFRQLQSHPNSFARIGHAYFSRVGNSDELKRLWDHQLSFHFEKAFRQSPTEYEKIRALWDRVLVDDDIAPPPITTVPTPQFPATAEDGVLLSGNASA